MYYGNGKNLEIGNLLYSPEKQVDIDKLDELSLLIYKTSKMIYDKYIKSGEVCIFICPGMKSGYGQGNMGGEFPRSSILKTKKGSVDVVWCDVALQKPNGTLDFSPKTYKYDKKMIVLDPTTDIEEILYHLLFSPRRKQSFKDVKLKKSLPAIYLRDTVAEANQHLSEISKNIGVIFYLTDESSPIVDDKKIINVLCSAWGVPKPDAKNIAICKSELIKAVEQAEKLGDEDFGYKGFTKAVKDVLADNAEKLSVYAIVQQAIDRSHLKWYQSELTWYLMGEGHDNKLKVICKVPANEATRNKKFLVDYLFSKPDDIELLQAGIDAIVFKPKQKNIYKVYLPENLTKEFFTEEIKWPQHRGYFKAIGGGDWSSIKKADMIEHLIDYFITQGKTLPDDLITRDPNNKTTTD